MTEFAEISDVTQAELPVPRRPRVLAGVAVLRRRTGELQIGIEPDHATVLSGLSPTVERAMHRLTGAHTVADLLGTSPEPQEHDELAKVLRQLDKRGLVEDATDHPRPTARLAADVTSSVLNGLTGAHVPDLRAHATIEVHGNGRLAIAVACLLAAAGVGRVHPIAGGVVVPEDVGTGYLESDVGRPRRTAAREAIERVEPCAVTRPLRRPTLVVLADSAVPRPDVVTKLSRAKVPHLLVRVHERTGVVGPLVVPGRSSCLHCADLRRTELDPCWPSVAAQLAGQTRPADLACAQAVAALAAAQALRFVAWRPPQSPPPVWNGSIELDPFESTTLARDWPPHPACPCGAHLREENLDR
ncbi:TOMM precursor leader peptide-binding protein [Labedaea rhizosphaerae]|nr:TOMM precursor leader peptide-binding protein [Labedaea rhizosphaerae]